MLHLISYELMRHNQRGFMYRGARVGKKLCTIKSSLFEGIFKDAKGVNCASFETACNKIFLRTISEILLEHKQDLVSEFMGHHICKQNTICALNSFKSYYKSN